MHGALHRLFVALLLLFPASQASAVSFGVYGEWSTGSQSFDFIDGIDLDVAYWTPGCDSFCTQLYVPGTDFDQSQWSLGALLDTNVAKDSLFGYRLEIGYERATKQANGAVYQTLFNTGNLAFSANTIPDVIGNGFEINNIFAFGVLRRERFKLWLGPNLRLGFQAYQYPLLGTGYEFSAGAGVRAGVNYHVSDRVSLSLTAGYTYVGRVGAVPFGNASGRFDDSGYTQGGNMFGINLAVILRGAGDQFTR